MRGGHPHVGVFDQAQQSVADEHQDGLAVVVGDVAQNWRLPFLLRYLLLGAPHVAGSDVALSP
jgi:hypothetical protein